MNIPDKERIETLLFVLPFTEDLLAKARLIGSKPINIHFFTDPFVFKQKKVGWYGWCDLENGRTVCSDIVIPLEVVSKQRYLSYLIPYLVLDLMNQYIAGKINL